MVKKMKRLVILLLLLLSLVVFTSANAPPETGVLDNYAPNYFETSQNIVEIHSFNLSTEFQAKSKLAVTQRCFKTTLDKSVHDIRAVQVVSITRYNKNFKVSKRYLKLLTSKDKGCLKEIRKLQDTKYLKNTSGGVSRLYSQGVQPYRLISRSNDFLKSASTVANNKITT